MLVVLGLMKQSAHGSIQALTAADHGGRSNLYRSVWAGWGVPYILKCVVLGIFGKRGYSETMCLFTPQSDSFTFMP